MARLSIAAAVVVVAALAVGPAGATPAGARIHSLEYVGGGVIVDEQRRAVLRAGGNVGAVVFRGGPERLVSIEIADAHGLPVTAVVAQGKDAGTRICGATRKPMRIRPYEEVTVFLMNGACGSAGASVATTGTVTARFTR